MRYVMCVLNMPPNVNFGGAVKISLKIVTFRIAVKNVNFIVSLMSLID